MAVVGTAYVRVKLISDKLAGDLNDSITKAFAKTDLDKIGQKAGDKIGQSIAESVGAAVEEQVVEVEAHVDSTAAKKELHDLTEDRTVTIDPDLPAKEVSAKLMWLTRLRKVFIRPILDTKAMAFVEGALLRLSGINLFKKWGRGFKEMFKNLDTMAPMIGGVAVGLTGVVGLAGSLTGWLGLAVTQLASLSALALPLPGLFAGALLPLMSVVTAFKDKESQKNLKGIGEQFTELKKLMAGSFWEQALTPLKNMTDTIMPALKSGMTDVSSATGTWFASITKAIGSASGVASLSTIFANVAAGTRGAADGTGIFTGAMLKLTAAGSAYLPQISKWFEDIATRFDAWITGSIKSGAFNDWVTSAMTVLRTLKDIIVDVGGVFGGLGKAAEAAGGGGIFTFAKAMDGLNKAINSETGQAALTSFFAASEAASAKIGEGLGKLGAGFVSFLPTFNTAMVNAGTAIGKVGEILGDVFANPAFQSGFGTLISGMTDGISSLAGASGPLGDILGAVAGVVGTFLKAIGPSLSAALTAVAPLIVSVADSLKPLIENLGGALTGAIQAITPMIAGMAPTIGALVPVFLGLAVGFKGVSAAAGGISAVAGGISFLSTAFQTIKIGGIKALVGAFVNLGKFAPVINLLKGALGGLGGAFKLLGGLVMGHPIIAIIALITAGIIYLWTTNEGFRNAIIGIWNAILGAIQGFGEWVTGTFVPGFLAAFNGIVAFMGALPGNIIGAITGLLAGIAAWAAGVWGAAKAAFSAGVSAVVSFVSALPGRVIGAITGLLASITSWAAGVWSRARSAFITGVNNAVAAVTGLPGRVISGVSSLIGRIASWASSTWSRARSAFITGVSNVVSTVSGLPGRVVSALSGLGGRLYSTGTSMIQGLINGIKAAAGRVAEAAKSVVTGAIDAAKRVLRINSPSRVFHDLGTSVGEGFISGLVDMQRTVARAGATMVSAAIPTGGLNIPLKVPHLADGGLIGASTGGTLALLAEARRDERVEPLDRNGLSRRDYALINAIKAMAGGAGNVSIGNIVVPLEDLAQLRDLEQFLELFRVRKRKQG